MTNDNISTLRPWLNAVEGEAWELYFYNDPRPVVAVVKRVSDPYSDDLTYSTPSSLVFVGEEYNNRVSANEIEEGRRIWPADTPRLKLDPLPYVAWGRTDADLKEVDRGKTRADLDEYAIVTFKPRLGYEQTRVYYLWTERNV